MKKQINKKPQDTALKGVTAELLSLRKDLQDFARHVDQAFVQAQATTEDRFQTLETRMGQRFDVVETRLAAVETKLDGVAEDVSKIKLAVVDLMQTDRHLRNLVTELQNRGIDLDPVRIFAA